MTLLHPPRRERRGTGHLQQRYSDQSSRPARQEAKRLKAAQEALTEARPATGQTSAVLL